VTELEQPGAGAQTRRTRRRERRWPALIGGLVLIAVKSEAYGKLLFHRAELIGVLAVAVGVSLLRARPVGLAVSAAVLLALVLGAHSLGLGVGLGFGAFALLMALFFAVSTVLHLRQRR
jgi:hypothetical protein